MTRLIVRPAAEADILADDEKAIVIAILHQGRAPWAWKKRVRTEGGGKP
jgi:hypothetical protein